MYHTIDLDVEVFAHASAEHTADHAYDGGRRAAPVQRQAGALMHARVTTAQLWPNKLDQAVEYMRDRVLPELRQLPGFVDFKILIDRESSEAIMISVWKDQDALLASQQGSFLQDLHAVLVDSLLAPPEVRPYEVVVSAAP
jgi:quinol monooxygenase YgiN